MPQAAFNLQIVTMGSEIDIGLEPATLTKSKHGAVHIVAGLVQPN